MYIPGILGIAGSDLSEEAKADTDTKELLREGNGYDVNNSDLSTLLFEQTNRVGHLQRILSGYSDTRDKNELLVRTLSKYNAMFSVEPIIQAILHQSKLKASLYCKPAADMGPWTASKYVDLHIYVYIPIRNNTRVSCNN